MSNKKYFGTDGIRGRVGKSLINAEFMLKLGWAMGVILSKNRKSKKPVSVLLGKDTRISGYTIETALQAGLSAAGVDIYLSGPLPTPGVAYLTHSLRVSAGMMISASHNSYQDNGVKFFDSRGMKLSDDMELAIEAQIEQPMRTAESKDLGKIERLVDAQGRYIEFCKSTFPSHLNLKGLKLVVDCANGATYNVAPSVFHELGANVTAIHDLPDGYNINQRCGATDLQDLQRKVVEEQADVGIALDGDGDRLIMVDHNGEIVDGDEMLCIIAKDRATGIGTHAGVVGTVMSNLGLEEALKDMGIAFIRAPVGDRYVLEQLKEKGWTLGGESSGHIVDLDYTTTGDGIITALQILRIIRIAKKSLHQLKQAMVKCPQVLINVPVMDKAHFNNNPTINKAVAKIKQELADEGRVLLRPSGTEHCVRVMVEGHNEAKVRLAAKSLAEAVSRAEI